MLLKKRMHFLFILFCVSSYMNGSIGITNHVTPGRFGDNVIQYVKTKWWAYKYNLNFYLKPFYHVYQLNAYWLEKKFTNHIASSYRRRISINHESQILLNMKPGTIFIVEPYARGYEYGTEDLIVFLLQKAPDIFIESIRNLITPTNPIFYKFPSFKIPTVAVHIRKPSKGDYPLYSIQEYDKVACNSAEDVPIINSGDHNKKGLYSDIQNGALKFPPNQFYIDQIIKLSNYLNNAPLFVQIFTDDLSPTDLAAKIKECVQRKLKTSNIIWGEAITEPNIIADYFNMSRFDYLIKSISSFSSISQLLGKHHISFLPSEYQWTNNTLFITKATRHIRDIITNKINNTVCDG